MNLSSTRRSVLKNRLNSHKTCKVFHFLLPADIWLLPSVEESSRGFPVLSDEVGNSQSGLAMRKLVNVFIGNNLEYNHLRDSAVAKSP